MSTVSPATKRRGLLAFGLAAAAVVVLTWQRNAGISNDGVQYVEGARRLLAGDGYSTSILYFDEHYRSGTLPSPQTVWPPGTSGAIAAVSALGIEPEVAGRVVARVAYLFLPPLVFLIGIRLTGSAVAAAWCAVWQLGMTEFWMYLGTPNSDLPFLAASLGAIALLPDRGQSRWRWLAASLLGSLAVLFRYAGVFLLLPIALVLVTDAVQTWRRSGTLALGPIAFAAPGFAIVGALLLRNRLLAGDLRGGNTRVLHQPLGGLLTETFRSLLDTLGGIARSDFAAGGVRAVAATVGAIGLGVLTLAAGRGAVRLARSFTVGIPAHRYFGVLGLMVLTYIVAMVVTASRTMLTYGQRYLLPVLPLIACLLISLALQARTDRARNAA